jgi:FlaG/FlaF family flagellin (archaellin)
MRRRRQHGAPVIGTLVLLALLAIIATLVASATMGSSAFPAA